MSEQHRVWETQIEKRMAAIEEVIVQHQHALHEIEESARRLRAAIDRLHSGTVYR